MRVKNQKSEEKIGEDIKKEIRSNKYKDWNDISFNICKW